MARTEGGMLKLETTIPPRKSDFSGIIPVYGGRLTRLQEAHLSLERSHSAMTNTPLFKRKEAAEELKARCQESRISTISNEYLEIIVLKTFCFEIWSGQHK